MTDRQQMAVSVESEFTLQCGEAARRLQTHIQGMIFFFPFFFSRFLIYKVALGKIPIFQRAHKQRTVAGEVYLAHPS